MTLLINLNSKIINPAPIMSETYAMPEEMDFASPEEMAMLDARLGLECQPLEWFWKLENVERYIIRWKETTEAIAQAVDYEDDQLDREWHSRGQW